MAAAHEHSVQESTAISGEFTMRKVRNAIALSIAAATISTGVAVAAPASATTPGQLGGLSIAGYCAGLGYANDGLARNAITGPNFAYNNWDCVALGGAVTPIAATGPAPSMTDACRVQYPGVATFALADDPDNAFTWNCYLLPPSSGTSTAAEDRSAVTAIISTDAVQAEITQLRALVAARKPLQALSQGLQFLSSRSTQELVADVLSGYGLPGQQIPVSALVGIALVQAVLG